MPTVNATVPVTWTPHHIGRALWCRPRGCGTSDYHELVAVDYLGATSDPTKWWNYRAWVRHRGQIKPARLPKTCTFADLPSEECTEWSTRSGSKEYRGRRWNPPSGPPPHVEPSLDPWDDIGAWKVPETIHAEVRPGSGGALFDL